MLRNVERQLSKRPASVLRTTFAESSCVASLFYDPAKHRREPAKLAGAVTAPSIAWFQAYRRDVAVLRRKGSERFRLGDQQAGFMLTAETLVLRGRGSPFANLPIDDRTNRSALSIAARVSRESERRDCPRPHGFRRGRRQSSSPNNTPTENSIAPKGSAETRSPRSATSTSTYPSGDQRSTARVSSPGSMIQ
jgi:hypothetical protein